jgi:hypothetical protein
MPSVEVSIHDGILPQRVDRGGLNVREDVLCTDAKGRTKAKLQKRSEAVFEEMGEEIRRVLEPDETIFYIATAQPMPGAFAQFFGGGWHAYSLPRSLLILTDRRLLALRQRKHIGGWTWDRGVRAARWGDVQDVSSGGIFSRSVTFRFRSGERQAYWRFALGNSNKVVLVARALQVHASGEVSGAGRMVSLCPRCLAQLAPRHYRCATCGLQFKDEGTLLRRGILIPGGASLYVGATGLGVLRSVFEAVILLSILLSLSRAITSPKGSSAAATLAAAILLELGVLALDKVMAIALSRPQIRDFIPSE